MGYEAETPGMLRDPEQFQAICLRYCIAGKFVRGKQVLEVGCGAGLGLGYLAKRAEITVGGDFDRENIKFARQHYGDRLNLLLLDAHKLPFKENSFDVIIAVEVIYYLRNLDGFFDECRRILRKKGTLIVCLPNKDLPNFQGSKLSYRYYSSPELYSLLENHHFDVQLFGAFPKRDSRDDDWHKIKSIFFREMSKILNSAPAGKRIKDIYAKHFLRKKALKAELDDEDMESLEEVQLNPVPREASDTKHKILYAIAKRL